MPEKTSAEVLIGGKVYTLSGYEGEEYLTRVASYINNKINEFDGIESFRRFPGDMKATLIELNIADDFFKARAQAEKLEQKLEQKEREIYDLKHELVSGQLKAEDDGQALKEAEKARREAERALKEAEKTARELELKNKELLLNKTRLEASLEEALLGKLPGRGASGAEKPDKGASAEKPDRGAAAEGAGTRAESEEG